MISTSIQSLATLQWSSEYNISILTNKPKQSLQKQCPSPCSWSKTTSVSFFCFYPITAIQQRTNLLFEHEDTTSDIADTEAQVKTILEELVTSQASKRPDIFIKLVHAMRHLKFTSLSNLFWQIGDFNIPGHEETLRKVCRSVISKWEFFIKKRAALLAPVPPRVMKEGESK